MTLEAPGAGITSLAATTRNVGWTGIQLDVEDVDVLAHPLGADGLGDDDDVALDEPAQDDLDDGLAVGGADLAENLGEPTPSS